MIWRCHESPPLKVLSPGLVPGDLALHEQLLFELCRCLRLGRWGSARAGMLDMFVAVALQKHLPF